MSARLKRKLAAGGLFVGKADPSWGKEGEGGYILMRVAFGGAMKDLSWMVSCFVTMVVWGRGVEEGGKDSMGRDMQMCCPVQ